MQDIKREITEEEYRTLIDKNYNEQHEALFPDGVPMTWSAGYGYYGHRLAEIGGKFFAIFSLGNSCD